MKYIVSLTSRVHLQGVSKMQNKMKLHEAKLYRKFLFYSPSKLFFFISLRCRIFHHQNVMCYVTHKTS